MIVPKKKSQVDLATVRCQKCLEYGHYSYECKNKRKIMIRDSRTKMLNKNLKNPQRKPDTSEKKDSTNAPAKKKSRKNSSSSSSSSSSDSSIESDSDLSSSSSSSSSKDSSDSDSDSSSSSSTD